MTKLLILLAIFCVFGIGAYAQVQKDSVHADPGWSVQTTTIPACDASNRGVVYDVRLANTADFTVKCTNNKGVYMLMPMPPMTGGAMREVGDGITDDLDGDPGAGGNFQGIDGTPNHPGMYRARTGLVIDDESVGGFMLNGGDFCPIKETNWDYEAIIQPQEEIFIVTAIGMLSDPDGQDDVHSAMFYYASQDAVVTDATNASPIVITTAAAHGYLTGEIVKIIGVVGNTAANGTFTITNLTSTTFSLDSSTGNSAYTSGGEIEYANWKTRSRTTGSYEVNDIGIEFDELTWYSMLMRATTSDIKFYMAVGDTADYSLVATHTTEIPSGQDLCGVVYVRTKETLRKDMRIDYMAIQTLGVTR